MPLDLFNDVFLLHFPFEAPEGIFQCFALLESDFRQMNTPPHRSWFYFPASAAFERAFAREVLISYGLDQKSQATILPDGRSVRFQRLKSSETHK